jgi:hypothetical protein
VLVNAIERGFDDAMVHFPVRDCPKRGGNLTAFNSERGKFIDLDQCAPENS